MNEKIKMEVPFFQAPNDIFEVGLTANEIIVYLYLARCGNNSTAFPSYKTIGEKTGTSRPTAMRIVKKLESIGLLYKESRKFVKETDEKQKVFNKSNVYVVQHDLSSFKAKGGITEILPLVSQRDHPSITVIPYKELPINNYINKELNINTDFLNKNQCELYYYKNCDEFLDNIFSKIDYDSNYDEELKNAEEMLRYFYHKFYEKYNYAITSLTVEQEEETANIINSNLGYMDIVKFCYYYVDYYLAEKRSKTAKDPNKKYHSFIQFIKGLDFEMMSQKANQIGIDDMEFYYEEKIS